MIIKHLMCLLLCCCFFFSLKAAENKEPILINTIQQNAINEGQLSYSNSAKGLLETAAAPNLLTAPNFSITIPNDTVYVCGGDEVTVIPDIIGIDPGELSYKWTADSVNYKNHIKGNSTSSDVILVNNANTKKDFPVKMVYTLTGTKNGQSSSDDVVVIFNDKPIVTYINVDTIVGGLSDTLEVNLSAELFSDTYTTGTWVQTGGPAKAEFFPPDSKKTVVEVAVAGVYTFLFKAGEGGCTSTSELSLEFVDIPIPYAGEDDAVCVEKVGANYDISYQLKGANYGDSCYWKVLSADGTVSFNDNKKANTSINVSQPGSYKLAWVNVNYDSNNKPYTVAQDTVELTFVEQPYADFEPGVSTGCGSLDVSFTNNSTGYDDISWDFGEKGTSDSSNPTDLSFENLSQSHKLYPISLVVAATTNGLTCADTLIDTITVYPMPMAEITTGYEAACSTDEKPLDIRFENESTGGVKYTWEFETTEGTFETVGVNTAASQTATFLNNQVNGGEFTRHIKLTAESEHGCTDTDELDLIIYSPFATGFSMSDETICDGANLTVEADGGAESYLWDFGNGFLAKGQKQTSPVVYTNNSGTPKAFIVSLTTTSKLGCQITTTDTITVLPQIAAGFTIKGDKFSQTSELETEVSDLSENADWLIWNWGDNSKDSTATGVVDFSHTFINGGLQKLYFNIIQTAYSAQGCSDDTVQTIEIAPRVTVDFTPSVIKGCSALPVTFTNNSKGLYSYKWDFGDGSATVTSENSFHTFTTDSSAIDSTTYTVTLTGYTYWGDSVSTTQAVTVNPTPVAVLDTTINKADNTIDFFNKSVGGTAYQWVFEADTITDNSTDPTHTLDLLYKDGRSKMINAALIASTGECRNQTNISVRYVPEVHADFSLNPDTVCSPTSSQLTSTSTGGVYAYWQIEGETIYGDTINYYFENTTDQVKKVDVTLVVKGNDNKEDQITKQVVVYPTPDANVVIDGLVVANENIEIENSSERGINYFWDFGDGTSMYNDSAFVHHTYTNNNASSKRYDLTLIASFNKCKDTVEYPVIVVPEVKADFIYDEAGCSPFNSNFVSTSRNASYLEWILPKGTRLTSDSLNYIFENKTDSKQTYTVTLIAHSTYGNSDTISKTVTVYPSPVAKIATDYEPACSSDEYIEIEFKNQSTGNGTYSWKFYDDDDITLEGDISKAPHVHRFENEDDEDGVFFRKAELVATLQTDTLTCYSSDSIIVMIYSPVSAEFDLSDETICEGEHISVKGEVGAKTYRWDFGNGTIATGINQYVNYENTTSKDTIFVISLTTISNRGCEATTTDTVTVLPKVVANFNIAAGTASSAGAQLITEVNDLSQNANALLWRWGDGSDDTTTHVGVTNLHHPYTNSGAQKLFFNIAQTASNSFGCSDDMVKTVEVTPYFNVDFEPVDTAGCSAFFAEFVNKSEGVYAFKWRYGDGSEISNSIFGSHLYTNTSSAADTFTVTLTGYSSWGDSMSVSKTIYVYPQPIASWEEPIVQNDSILFVNNSQRADSYQWVFNNDTINEITLGAQKVALRNEFGQVVPLNAQLIAVSGNHPKCTDIKYTSVKLDPNLEAAFTHDTLGCSPFTAVFDASESVGGYIYKWQIGDSIRSGSKISHTFINESEVADRVPVKLYVYGSNNQVDSIIDRKVYVFPTPKAAINVDATVVTGDTLTIANNALRATNYFWDFGDSQMENTNFNGTMQHVYLNGGSDAKYFILEFKASYTLADFSCADSLAYRVRVAPEVKADFSYTEADCSPFWGQFESKSTNANYLEWILPNGTYSSAKTLRYYFENSSDSIQNYSILLVAHSRFGNNDTVSKTVTVYPNPVVAFETDFEEGCSSKEAPIEIEFTNNTTGADSYVWRYQADENGYKMLADTLGGKQTFAFTNNNESGKIQFRNVWLVAGKRYGNAVCADSISSKVMLYSPLKVDFSLAKDTLCHGDEITAMASLVAKSYVWDFGNGQMSNSAFGGKIAYQNSSERDSNYTVSLKTISERGCEFVYTDTVTVLPEVRAGFEFESGTDSGVVAVVSKVKDASENATQLFWNWGDGESEKSGVGVNGIAHRYQNLLTTIQRFEVIQTARNGKGCMSTAKDTVKVYPEFKVDFEASVVKGCSPLFVQFTNKSVGESNVEWNLDNGEGSIKEENPFTYFVNNNSNGDSITYKVALTAYTNWGESKTVFKDIVVYTTPSAQWEVNIVDEAHVTFNNNSVGATNYTWIFNNDTTTTKRINQEFEKPLFDKYDRSKTVSAVLIATSDSKCSSAVDTTIRISPDVIADFELDTIGCSPLITTLKSTSVGGIIHQWKIGNDVIVGETVQYTFVNHSNVAIKVPVILNVFGNDSKSATVKKMVTIYPTPQANIWIDGLQVSGDTVAIENNTLYAQNYLWDFGDGTTSESGDSILYHIYQNSTSIGKGYDINLIASITDTLSQTKTITCADTTSFNLSIAPNVKAEFDYDTAGCAPFHNVLTAKCENETFAKWLLPDGTVSYCKNLKYYFDNQTDSIVTYDITLVALSSHGNNDTITKQVTVYPQVQAGFIVDELSDESMSPLAISLTDTSVNAQNIYWEYNNATLTQNAGSQLFDTLYTESDFRAVNIIQTAIAEYSGNFRCESKSQQTVVVYPQLVADFVVDVDSGCSDLKVNFTNRSENSYETSWQFGDGTTSPQKNPFYIYKNSSANDTTFTAVLTVTDRYGHKRSQWKTITVFYTPSVAIDLTAEGFNPVTVDAKANVIGAASLTWDMGNGERFSNSASLTYTYGDSTFSEVKQYEIILSAQSKNGCKDEAYEHVMVYPQLKARFFCETVECSPFWQYYKPEMKNAGTYSWLFEQDTFTYKRTFDKGYELENSSHEKEQNFTVKLVAHSKDNYAYTDTFEQIITVKPSPLARIITDTTAQCSPFTAVLENASEGYTHAQWYINGAKYGTNEEVAYDFKNITGRLLHKYVELEVVNGQECVASAVEKLTIKPNAKAEFDYQKYICSSSEDFYVTNLSGRKGEVYKWNFGDDSAFVFNANYEIQHVYKNTTSDEKSYNITLIANNTFNCPDTAIETVTVHPEPVLELSTSGEEELILPNAKLNAKLTIGNPSNNWRIKWNFNDTTEITGEDSVTYVYNTPGFHLLKLYVEGKGGLCSERVTKSILVGDRLPEAVFEANLEGCSPYKVTFKNQSKYATNYEWEFGDGGESMSENPTYLFRQAGIYTVTLRAYNSDNVFDTYQLQANIKQGVIANFEVAPTHVTSYAQKVFTQNESENATIFNWDFSDGITSTDQHPAINYFLDGVKDITLIASNEAGCSDTLRREAIVSVEDAGIQVPNVFRPNTSGGNGGVVQPDSPNSTIFYPVLNLEDVFEYQLQIYNRWGQLLYETNDVDKIGWDGYYNGQLAKLDVYVYRISVLFNDGTQQVKTGDVTLLR